MRSGGWPGRICFDAKPFRHGFSRICTDQTIFHFSFLLPLVFSPSRACACCRALCSGRVFAGVPQDRRGLHSFCTIHFAFRFMFAYAETADEAECNRDWL
jgi:hypothetical protein